jgi:hypothetical protein
MSQRTRTRSGGAGSVLSMFRNRLSIVRLVAAGLATFAITPATAVAVPAVDGLGAAQEDRRAPDQVAPPYLTRAQAPQPGAAKSSDDDVDTSVLIAVGGAAVVGLGGIGLARRIRVRAAHQRSLA